MKQTIWALIGIEEDDGILTLGDSPNELMPLVTMKEEFAITCFTKIGAEVAKVSGKQVVLGKFELEKVIERFT